jgi:GNAT superfamily N-acetyltransferase
MIFTYNQIIKDKCLKKYNKINKINYNSYYNSGLSQIKSKVLEFAESLNEQFIDQLFNFNDIKFIFYSPNTHFSMKYCNGIIIYTETFNNISKQQYIYLLLICIDKHYRKFGYGKLFIEDFIDYIKNINNNNKKIILHPLNKLIDFYKKIGFTEIITSPYKYRKLFKYEKYDKNALLLELNI